MNLRMGLVLAGSLAIVGGCAASGGGSTSGGTAMPSAGGEVLSQGERPREDDMTRAAERALEEAEDAETPEQAAQYYREAVTQANAAIQADSTNPLPYYQLGLAQMGLDDYVAADAAISRAEELRPVYTLETETMREQAWIEKYQEAAPLVNQGDYEGAIAAFEQADAIYDARPEVKAFLGQLYVQTGRYEDGLRALREAQEIINSPRVEQMDSATAAGWRETGEQLPVYVAQALMQTERYGEAAEQLEAMLVDDPGNQLYLQQLAAVYLENDQPEEAKRVYERMVEAGNLSAADHYSIGVGYYRLEDYPAAIDEFKTAAEMSANDRDALEMWARSVQLAYPSGEEQPEPPAGVLEEMVAAAERWLELDPYNRNAYLILAQTANRVGDGARAQELVADIEALEFQINSVQLQRYGAGGGMVSGSILNVSLEPGTNVTLNVQFYDTAGNVIGTEQTTVSMPAADATQRFTVELTSDETVGGYGYTATY